MDVGQAQVEMGYLLSLQYDIAYSNALNDAWIITYLFQHLFIYHYSNSYYNYNYFWCHKNVIVICFISFIYYSYGIRMYSSFMTIIIILCIRTFLIGYHHTFIVCDVNRQRNYRVCKWVQWQWKVIINNTIHYYQSSHQ